MQCIERSLCHCGKGFPSHNRYDGLYPFYRRSNRGSGRGEPAQGHKTREWRDILQQSERSKPKPALNYQQVLSKSVRAESSKRTSCALRSKISGAEAMAAGRTGGRAFQVPTSQGCRSLNWTQHSRAHESRGLQERQVDVPRPPRTLRPERERSSKQPGLPGLTLLDATQEGLRRYSPAKTPHSKGDCLGARVGPAQGGEGARALHS